jgi:hypothetical protein
MPVASISVRVWASGNVMRMVISVPAPSASNLVSMWLPGVGCLWQRKKPYVKVLLINPLESLLGESGKNFIEIGKRFKVPAAMLVLDLTEFRSHHAKTQTWKK